MDKRKCNLNGKINGFGIGCFALQLFNNKGAYAWQTGATKAVTANTTYYVYAKDAAGNISAPTTVAVGKIDKTAD